MLPAQFLNIHWKIVVSLVNQPYIMGGFGDSDNSAVLWLWLLMTFLPERFRETNFVPTCLVKLGRNWRNWMIVELLMMILLLKHDMRECRCDHRGTRSNPGLWLAESRSPDRILASDWSRSKGSLHDFTIEQLLLLRHRWTWHIHQPTSKPLLWLVKFRSQALLVHIDHIIYDWHPCWTNRFVIIKNNPSVHFILKALRLWMVLALQTLKEMISSHETWFLSV